MGPQMLPSLNISADKICKTNVGVFRWVLYKYRTIPHTIDYAEFPYRAILLANTNQYGYRTV